MGSIVGAAIVSHHPGLMQCEEFRVLQGAGADSDLIPGYARLRAEELDLNSPSNLLLKPLAPRLTLEIDGIY